MGGVTSGRMRGSIALSAHDLASAEGSRSEQSAARHTRTAWRARTRGEGPTVRAARRSAGPRSLLPATQNLLDALDQTTGAERLDDVVHGTHFVAQAFVEVAPLGGEQHHRDVLRL